MVLDCLSNIQSQKSFLKDHSLAVLHLIEVFCFAFWFPFTSFEDYQPFLHLINFIFVACWIALIYIHQILAPDLNEMFSDLSISSYISFSFLPSNLKSSTIKFKSFCIYILKINK